MIKFNYDPQDLTIEQIHQDNGYEFHIHILNPNLVHLMKEVGKYFNENRDVTDVIMATFKDNRFSAIVRRDYYEDFIIALFRFGILKSLHHE